MHQSRCNEQLRSSFVNPVDWLRHPWSAGEYSGDHLWPNCLEGIQERRCKRRPRDGEDRDRNRLDWADSVFYRPGGLVDSDEADRPDLRGHSGTPPRLIAIGSRGPDFGPNLDENKKAQRRGCRCRAALFVCCEGFLVFGACRQQRLIHNVGSLFSITCANKNGCSASIGRSYS